MYPTIQEARGQQFLEIPDDEGLIGYFSCSLRGDGLPSKGVLYLSQRFLCFATTSFFFPVKKLTKLSDVRSIEICRYVFQESTFCSLSTTSPHREPTAASFLLAVIETRSSLSQALGFKSTIPSPLGISSFFDFFF